VTWNTLMVSLGGMGLYSAMLVRGSVARTSANFYLVPGTVAVLAWVLLGEQPSWLAIAGLIVASPDGDRAQWQVGEGSGERAQRVVHVAVVGGRREEEQAENRRLRRCHGLLFPRMTVGRCAELGPVRRRTAPSSHRFPGRTRACA